MSNALSQMITALGLEAAAIRRRGGASQAELRGGERVGQAEGSWLYRFIMTEDLNLRDDTPVRVTCEQDQADGTLVSFRDGVLLVSVDKDLGPKIATARLLADESFLLERLQERLEKVRAGEAHFNRTSAERALGLAPARPADAEPDPAVLEAPDGLNPDQIQALRCSLGNNVTFVWGPPGTGKTTTLARIVEAHYRAGRSVLLVSNTNIAVDTALECVAERLKGESAFHQGLVIRQGPLVKEELRSKFGAKVILEEIVARLGEGLRREKGKLEREASPPEAEERALAAALKDLEQFECARRSLAGREEALAATRSKAEARDREADEYRSEAATLRSDLDRARTMGAIRRFFSGLNPERLERKISRANRAAQAAAEAARALVRDITQHEADIKRRRADVDRFAVATRAYPPAQEIRTKLSSIRAELARIRERITAIDAELASLEQEIIARCRILATTVYRTYLGKRVPRQFDAVVIDEASMLTPPLVYYAAGLATQSVTIAGDFRQLPPIVMSEEPLAAEWLKQNAFEKADIPRQLEGGDAPPHVVHLGIQYRMREPICSLINDLFYNDYPLESHPSVRRRDDGFPFGPSPLLYVETSPFHPWTALRAGTHSRYNLFHALLVRNIVIRLAETGFLPPLGKPNDKVGAVTPYAGQARILQALLDDRPGISAAGVAATVHRFQGNEKAAMVLDLTDSFGTPVGRFLQATRLEEDGARLLNVALSRARDHIVLLANFEYLRAKAARDTIVRKLLDHFEEHGEALPVDGLLPLGDSDWLDCLHTMLPATFDLPEGAAGAFTEGTFYPAFLKDLSRAGESVVIFSPFLTLTGASRWVEPLRAALTRGGRIRIVTRPPEEPGGSATGEVRDVVLGLRELGITVDLRARMHEKMAIVDGRILWHGSLNILSHRDTHESMLRIDSPAVCAQLARFVSEPAARRADAPALGSARNPECPICGGPTIWQAGRLGIHFECENPKCGGRVDRHHRRGGRPMPSTEQRNKTRRPGTRRRKQSGKALGDRPCPAARCDGNLVERNGRFGRFLGCTNYPVCRYTEDLH